MTFDNIDYKSADRSASILISGYIVLGILLAYTYAGVVMDFSILSFGRLFNLTLLCVTLGSIVYFTNRNRSKILNCFREREKRKPSNYPSSGNNRHAILNFELKLSACLFCILFIAQIIFSFAFSLLHYEVLLWMFVTIIITCMITGTMAYPAYMPMSKSGIRESLATAREYIKLVSHGIFVFVAGTILVFYSQVFPNMSKQYSEACPTHGSCEDNIAVINNISKNCDSLEVSLIKDSSIDYKGAYYSFHSSLKNDLIPQIKRAQLINDSAGKAYKEYNNSIKYNAKTVGRIIFPFVMFAYWVFGLVMGVWGPISLIINLLTARFEIAPPEVSVMRGEFPGLIPPSYPQTFAEPNYKSIVENLEAIVKRHPETSTFNEVLSLYNNLIDSNPDSNDLKIAKARILKSMGNIAEADKTLEDALKKDPDNAQALFDRSQIYYSLANTLQDSNARKVLKENAFDLVKRANISSHESDPRILTSLGYGLWILGDFAEAMSKTILAEKHCTDDNRRQKFAIYNNLAYYHCEMALKEQNVEDLKRSEEYGEKLRPFLDGTYDPPMTSSEQYDTLAYIQLAKYKVLKDTNALSLAHNLCLEAIKRNAKNEYAASHLIEIKKLLEDPQ